MAEISDTSTPDPATRGFVFNHTMLRVKDIARSVEFYTEVLGFSVIDQRDYPEGKFSLTFLILDPQEAARRPQDKAERRTWMAGLKGVLELTHNHGTEQDDAFTYHDGNSEPRGFGHICVAVPDARAACERFERMDVAFQKRLGEGGMKSIAFIKDPDGYWIEIIQPTPMA